MVFSSDCDGRCQQNTCYPHENEKLAGTEQTIKDMLTGSFKDKVRILYLEYLVEKILQSVDATNTRMFSITGSSGKNI
jgi:hypothetical protein